MKFRHQLEDIWNLNGQEEISAEEEFFQLKLIEGVYNRSHRLKMLERLQIKSNVLRVMHRI